LVFGSFGYPYGYYFGPVGRGLRTISISVLAILFWVGGLTGLVTGISTLLYVAFAQPVTLVATVELAILGIAAIAIGLVQFYPVGFCLWGVMPQAWFRAILISVTAIAYSPIGIALVAFLFFRDLPITGSNLGGLVMVGVNFFWLLALALILGVFTVIFLTRREQRAIFGKLRPQDVFPNIPR